MMPIRRSIHLMGTARRKAWNVSAKRYPTAMRWTVRKFKLNEEKFELIEDPQQAFDTFAAILQEGRSLYPKDRTSKRSRRICRVVPLAES
jgi:hypothetical protein